MRKLTKNDGQQLALLVNFFGELRLNHMYLNLNFWSQAHDRVEALTKLGEWLELPLQYQKPRHLIRLHQAETHQAYEVMWPHLVRYRQFEFNAMIDRQQLLIDERAAQRRERDREYSEAASRAVPSYEQRHAMAEALYDNSDPAVQVIDDLTPDMAIAAELATAATFRAEQAKRDRDEMTKGQVPTNLYAPKRQKRKYTRKS